MATIARLNRGADVIFKVLHRSVEKAGVLAKKTDCRVAFATEQPTNLPGFVVMIDGKEIYRSVLFVGFGFWLVATIAKAVSLLEHFEIFRMAYAQARPFSGLFSFSLFEGFALGMIKGQRRYFLMPQAVLLFPTSLAMRGAHYFATPCIVMGVVFIKGLDLFAFGAPFDGISTIKES